MSSSSHRPSVRLLRRIGAVTAAAALTLGVAAAPSDAARGAQPGVGWLAGQLEGGLIHNDQFDFDDYGLSADVALALDAVDVREQAQARISRALARNVENWISGAGFGSDDQYAGSTAKALVTARALGADPRDFGGADLVARLDRLVLDEGPTAGRIRDSGDDFANTIGQSFAARGLTQSRSPKAADAVDFLLKQQCRAGFFRLSFAPEGSPQQRCNLADPADRAPDTDATALALVNLQALANKTPAIQRSIARGARWLAGVQKRDGSIGIGDGSTTPNTNSTGLAAWALGEASRCPAAVAAASWVRGLQKSNGAIAYDAAGLQAGRDGIGVAEQDQFRRATAQAAPGLLNSSLAACRG